MEGWHGKFYPYKKGGERIFLTILKVVGGGTTSFELAFIQ